jgi:hypothetical protein
MVRDAELGRRLVEKLGRLWCCQGDERLVLAHVEMQGEHDPELAHSTISMA